VCAGVSFGKPRFLEPMVGGRISANHPWHTGRPRNQHGLGEDILLYVSRESVTGQRSNQLNYVPNLLFIRLAPNPHVCCLLLLSTISPLSTVSTGSIEIPGEMDSMDSTSN
jgi:hypothetical protein